jgi:hypothetical protein
LAGADSVMATRCYHCTRKFTSLSVVVEHCFADHHDKPLSILQSYKSGENRTKYISKHYGILPKDIVGGVSALHIDNENLKITLNNPIPNQQPNQSEHHSTKKSKISLNPHDPISNNQGWGNSNM